MLDWTTEQKETKPVARYSGDVKALEENGVGRPSTYAAIMSKLDEREYVEKVKVLWYQRHWVASWLVWCNELS